MGRIYAWLDKSLASTGSPIGIPTQLRLAITLLESLYRYSAVKVKRDPPKPSKKGTVPRDLGARNRLGFPVATRKSHSLPKERGQWRDICKFRKRLLGRVIIYRLGNGG